MDGDAPKILLRDRDDMYGPSFVRVIKTAVRARNMNAVAERFVGSARRETLDHVIVLDDQHLGRLIRQYQEYLNGAMPHQGIEQRIPGKEVECIDLKMSMVVRPMLGGLHHDHRRAA